MTDPISGEMASQAAQSAVGGDPGVGAVDGADPSADFSEAMGDQGGADVDAAQGGADPMQVEATDPIDRIEGVGEIPTDDFVQKLLREEDRIQEMMEQSLSGSDMGQEEMLQMQAVIYSYSQRVDLTTKVVENATGGVKQVMNTQV